MIVECSTTRGGDGVNKQIKKACNHNLGHGNTVKCCMNRTRLGSAGKVFLSILVFLILFGCSENSNNDKVPSPQQHRTEAGPRPNVTLTIMAPQDSIKEVEQFELAKKFKEETGIAIDFQITPADQYGDLLGVKLNTRTSSDIFFGQSGALNVGVRYNPEQNCVDLSDEPWTDKYDQITRGAGSHNGRLYCMTIWDMSSVWGIVYNKSIFADFALSAPRTYDEFIDVCEVLKSNGITPLYECVADAWHPVCSFVEVFIQIEKLNPGTFDKLNNNSIKLADIPEAYTLLGQIKEVGQNYQGDSYLSNDFAGGAAAMASGNYAMMVNRPSFINEIAENFGGAKYGSAADYGVFVLPYLDNTLRNINPQAPSRFIFSGSPNIDEAKLYLNFLAENLQVFIDKEPAISTLPFSGLTNQLSAEEMRFLADYPESGVVMQSAVLYIDPQWKEIAKDIRSLYLDEITPRQLLDNMDRRRSEQALQADDINWPSR